MTICKVTIDYHNELNSGNKEWLSTDLRHINIQAVSEGEKYEIDENLTFEQCEHLIALIQDNRRADVEEMIEFYRKLNTETYEVLPESEMAD